MTSMSPVLVVVAALAVAATASAAESVSTPTLRRLNQFIEHFEPLSFDREELHARHRRTLPDDQLSLHINTHGRELELVLKQSAKKIFTPNFKVKVHHGNGRIEFHDLDQSVFYRGHIQGQRIGSDVRAVIHEGLFSGLVHSAEDRLYIEPASEFFSEPVPFTHVAYSSAHLVFNLTEAHERKFEGGAYQRMLDQQRGLLGSEALTAHFEQKRRHRLPTATTTPQADGPARARSRRAYNPAQHTTCELAMVADHLYFAADGQGSVVTTSNKLIAHMEAANTIYKNTAFTGVSGGAQFALQKIQVYTDGSDVDNPYRDADTSINDVNNFLNRLSEGEQPGVTGLDDWDDVCLAHTFTHRDFDGGILGLAWVGASNAGICTNAQNFAGGRKTLNTGITTTLNFGSDVPTIVADITLAHEFGHNFGSTHDVDGLQSSSSEDCAPAGLFGNYVMYERATSGNEPNNDVFSPCSRDLIGSLLLSKADQCFSNRGGDPICGNGIFEGDPEECDCGSTTSQTDCDAIDPCCQTDCTLKPTSECSDRAGECCSSCSLIGVSFAGNEPAEPTGAELNSVSQSGGFRCASESDCSDARYCVADSLFKGACPPDNWVRDVTTPTYPVDESVDENTPACPDAAGAENCYFYHKSRGTSCNSGANVCTVDGCTGSICSKYNRTDSSGNVPASFVAGDVDQCVPTESGRDCQVGCEFQVGVCVSTFMYANTSHGLSMGVVGAYRAPGRSCDNGEGYCNGGGNCVGAGADTPIDTFLQLDFSKWIEDNWPVVVGVVLGGALLVVLLQVTYRVKKPEIDSGMKRIGHTIKKKTIGRAKSARTRQGIARPPGANGTPLSGPQATNRPLAEGTGLARLNLLFPTVKNDSVMAQVMKAASGEEDAVIRLLKMGYPLQAV
eukprot:m.16996 g.16996  ORF g.16996 m.16996 type:complete len:900 (+) comp5367_c0_seq1:358-3057(+)